MSEINPTRSCLSRKTPVWKTTQMRSSEKVTLNLTFQIRTVKNSKMQTCETSVKFKDLGTITTCPRPFPINSNNSKRSTAAPATSYILLMIQMTGRTSPQEPRDQPMENLRRTSTFMANFPTNWQITTKTQCKSRQGRPRLGICSCGLITAFQWLLTETEIWEQATSK